MSFALPILVKTTVILYCASALTLTILRAAASTRHAILALALGAVLAVPLISALAPSLDLPLLPPTQPARGPAPVSALAPAAEVQKPAVATEGQPAPAGPQANRTETSVAAARPWGWSVWLGIIWGLGCLVLTLRWLVGQRDLRDLKRRSALLVDGSWPQLLTDLKRELKLATHVEVRIGDDSVPPMTWGVFRQVVLLPASAVEWPLDRQRAVLAHELAHVKRRDGLVRVITEAARVVYWFHPFVWYVAHELEVERELACDDCVLRLGTDAADYAGHLVAIARDLNSGRPPAAASMGNAAQLKTRLRAILEPRTRRRVLSRAAFGTLVSFAAMGTASMAAIQLTTDTVSECSDGIERGTSIAADTAGNLFFADGRRNQILKLAQDGASTVVAGTGTRGFSGDGGPATAAQLGRIISIAASPAGDLFIAEANPPRIRKVTAAGTISTFAGNGQLGVAGDGGPATAASMCKPAGLALDASGTLYVSFGFSGIDSLNGDFRIRKIDNNGVISTFAGGGTPWLGESIPDGGLATSAPFYIGYLAAGDAAGNLFLSGGARVRKITPSGIVSTVAGVGKRAFSGDGGPATSAQLGLINGIAVDKTGNLFISEFSNHRVRKVTPDGTISTVAGNGTDGFSRDGTAATAAQLTGVGEVATDGHGNIFIWENESTDGGPPWTRRIRKVNKNGVISTLFSRKDPVELLPYAFNIWSEPANQPQFLFEATIQGPIWGWGPIHGPAPVYPPAARAAGIHGIVKLEVQIERDGHVSAARVLTGHDLLKDAALEAARKFVVEPQPSALTTTAELNFMLN
jgi:TonB family protein